MTDPSARRREIKDSNRVSSRHRMAGGLLPWTDLIEG